MWHGDHKTERVWRKSVETSFTWDNFPCKKKVLWSRSSILVQKYVFLLTRIDFWALNSISQNLRLANSVTDHPGDLTIFFSLEKCLNYPSFTGICDRSGSFWDLGVTLLFEARCRFSKNQNATHHDPNPTAEHAMDWHGDGDVCRNP